MSLVTLRRHWRQSLSQCESLNVMSDDKSEEMGDNMFKSIKLRFASMP